MNRSLLNLAGSILGILASASGGFAQKQAPMARVTSRLVQVNVVVQDKKGQPVTELTKEDFEVTDQGKPQKIAVFSMESNLKEIGRAETLPANTYSNIPSRAGATQNFTAILFDTLNTPGADQITAKRELVGFLRQIKPQDRVALYGLGNSLRAIHDFTGNAEALVRAVAHYEVRVSTEALNSNPKTEDNTSAAIDAQERAVIQQMDDFLNESNRLVADAYIVRRMNITLQALETIAYHLASIPGRKSLVWVSASFPFSYGSDVFMVNQANEGSKNFSEVITRVAKAITSANVAIYPVDARGFLSASILNPTTSAETMVSSARRGVGTDSAAMDQLMSSHNTMQELAERTGGRALYSTNDVQGAIQRALDDSRVTYTLGYYPETKFDGKFRAIKISVNRPGVQLKYRRGYFALPDEPMDAAHRQSAIAAAAVRPLDETGISFTCRMEKPAAPPGNVPAAVEVPITLDIDPRSLTFEDMRDMWSGGLDMVFAQLDSTGNIVGSIGRNVPMMLTRAQHDQLLRDGLVFNSSVKVDPKSDRVRIILRDDKSGSIGTVTIPAK